MLWGGRFKRKLAEDAFAFNTSLAFDYRMGVQDVRGSLAWAQALERAGVLTPEECHDICQGLAVIQQELEAQTFEFQEEDEDIHTAVERRLGALVGPAAGKLHTGRSRNDQVATDFRLWLLDHLPRLEGVLVDLQDALVGRAESDLTVVMPGYTHLQRAQPVLLGHWWLSHFWPLQRDRQRLADLVERTSMLPLGSGALAGTPYPVDRFALAEALGFREPSPNSLDGVADRDFAAEFLFCAAMIGVHLSKLAESMVLFTTAEFGFFELDDAYATGSSLMPQKKNPDVFELARGKAGKLAGLLSGFLTTLKGLPSTYDKDLQDDKPAVFEAYDLLVGMLPVIANALRTLTIKPERMRQGLDTGLLATDLADYLVLRGVPFREAHAVIGQVVQAGLEQGVSLDKLPLEVYKILNHAFDEDLYLVFDPLQSVKRRNVYGGTAPEAVQTQLTLAKAKLAQKS
jgi:argininosuccinate lyase